jgi:geranylgeranyl pyrophosphate synthase
MTLPLIHMLGREDGVAGTIVRDIIATRTASEDQWSTLLAALDEHRSLDYAYRVAADFAERAKKPLQIFPPSAERDSLMALPDYVLSRDR